MIEVMKYVDKNLRLPVFVYGTLTKGKSNFNRFLLGRTEQIKEAVLPGFGLSAPYRNYFPYMNKRKYCSAKGELMYVSEKDFPEVLRNLDYLEGVPTYYRRIIVFVRDVKTGEKVKAWTYISDNFSEKQRIIGGDWRKFNGRY